MATDGEKISKIFLFVLYERDGQTDGYDGIGRACIASSGKNSICLAVVTHSLIKATNVDKISIGYSILESLLRTESVAR